MKLGFVLGQMTYLRYFIPLVIEANKRGLDCVFFHIESHKYNSPHKHKKSLEKLCKDYNFILLPFEDLKEFEGIVFMMEGIGIDSVKKENKKIVLNYMRDFNVHYDKYVNKADYIILPSKFFADHYKKHSDKNLYLGTPKYDVEFNKEEIFKKYNIATNKNALIVFPTLSHLSTKYGIKNIKFIDIYKFLHKMGYNVMVKARGKEPAPNELRGDNYFEDFSWFPHDTMELIKICDIVISFDSGVSKECVMLDTPFINYHIIISNVFSFSFLYNNYRYCVNLESNVDFEEFSNIVNRLTTEDLTEEFKRSRKNHLFEANDVSKQILDVLKIC